MSLDGREAAIQYSQLATVNQVESIFEHAELEGFDIMHFIEVEDLDTRICKLDAIIEEFDDSAPSA